MKAILIAILIAPDFSSYIDFVRPFDTHAECEEAKKELLQSIPFEQFKQYYLFTTCVSPRPVGAVDV